jgi:signal peptidase II
MNRKEWQITLLPLLLVILIDQLTKHWAINLVETFHLIIFQVKLNLNQGFAFGLFSELPKLLRTVALSTGGVFLLVLYFLIQYLFSSSSLILRGGMSIFIGGVLGNVIDRINWGFVVDFLIIGTESIHSAVFNFADLFQLIGFILIIYSFIKDGDRFWPEKEERKSFWINKKFQLKYSLILTGVGFALSLITLTFCYTYLRISLLEFPMTKGTTVQSILHSFILIYTAISLIFCLILFVFGKIISHRIAGPLFAFERFLDNLLDGKPTDFKLRHGDDFMHLEEVAKKIQDKLSCPK